MRLVRRMLALSLTLQVVSAWALPAGVLCVADDGHLALKLAETECSHPGGHSHEGEHARRSSLDHGEAHRRDHDHAHRTTGAEHAASEHGCHPCVDVELREESSAQGSNDHHRLGAPPVSATHPAAGSLTRLPLATRRPALAAPSPPSPSLLALRTIVLTC